MAHRITCITTNDRDNPYERITHVGGIAGVSDAGGAWKVTLEEAIRGIESGQWSFYVKEDGRAVDVFVEVGPDGGKYLKTEADGAEPDTLLGLPECP